MNFTKRACISVRRMLGKTSVLLLTVMLLGLLFSMIVLIGDTINQTTFRLRSNMPPVVTAMIDLDSLIEADLFATYGDNDFNEEFLSRSTIREIGELPYVKNFNYSIGMAQFNTGFNRYRPDELDSDAGFFGLRLPVHILGVSSPDIIYIQEGNFELKSGRMFNEVEMLTSSKKPPILISEGFAATNNLILGSTLTIRDFAFFPAPIDMQDEMAWFFNDGNIWKQVDTLFEVVGLFDFPIKDVTNPIEIDNAYHHLNTFFIPSWSQEMLIDKNQDLFQSWVSEFEKEYEFRDLSIGVANELSADVIWVLHDPTEIDSFRDAAEALLPDFWIIDDRSNTFSEIKYAMMSLQGTINILFIIVPLGTLLTLSLLILLFIHDRRKEIGIYLALGERKSRILIQFLLETVSISLIGLILAIILASFTTSQFSQLLIQNEISNYTPCDPLAEICHPFESYLETSGGFGEQLSIPEMLDNFYVTLDLRIFLSILGAGIAIVTLATSVPVIYINSISPNDNLSSGKVG